MSEPNRGHTGLLPSWGKILFGFGVGLVSAFAPEFFSDTLWIGVIGLGIGVICTIGTISWAALMFLQRRYKADVLGKRYQILGICMIAAIALASLIGSYTAIEAQVSRIDLVYIEGIPFELLNGQQRFRLVLVNPNDRPIENVTFWISPISAKLNSDNPDYHSIDTVSKKSNLTLTQGLTVLPYLLFSGDYYIEFNMNNGLLLQSLRFVVEGNGLKQIIEIRNRETDEVILYREVGIDDQP